MKITKVVMKTEFVRSRIECGVACERDRNCVTIQTGNADDAAIQTGNADAATIQTGNADDAAIQTGNADDAAIQTGNADDAAIQTGNADDAAIQTGNADDAAIQTGNADDAAIQTGNADDAAIRPATLMMTSPASSYLPTDYDIKDVLIVATYKCIAQAQPCIHGHCYWLCRSANR